MKKLLFSLLALVAVLPASADNQVDLDEFQLKAADVNGDGIVGIADVTAINDLIL